MKHLALVIAVCVLFAGTLLAQGTPDQSAHPKVKRHHAHKVVKHKNPHKKHHT